VRAVLLVALLIATVLGYATRTSSVDRVRETAQKVLDTKLEANTLKVDQLRVPNLAFVPFVSLAEWRSYLFIADKNGRPLDREKCPSTVNYAVRLSSTNFIWDGGKFALRVYMEQLQQCSDAQQPVG